MNELVLEMNSHSDLRTTLLECVREGGFNHVNAAFETHGFSHAGVAERTQVLNGIMGVVGGGGTPGIGPEKVYALTTDYFVSGGWKKYACSCASS